MPDRDALEERLRLIVRTIAGRPDLEVTTRAAPEVRARMAAEGKNVDEEWFTWSEADSGDPTRVRRVFVHFPPHLLTIAEDVAKGKAAHVAGHVAITRHGGLVPDEVLAQPGFHLLMSSIEERPTDRVVALRYPGAGAWLRAARLDSLAEADETGAKATLGYVPRFMQLCNLIVYAPYTDQHDDLAPEGVATYRTIAADLAELEETLPQEGASEDEVREAAIARYRILYLRIWPKVRALVDEDTRAEIARRVALEPAAGCGPGRLGEISAEAALALEELEDALSGRLDGALDPDRPAPRGALRERDDGGARELVAIERRQAANAAERGPYERAYESVRAEDERLYERLEEVFQPRAGPSTQLRTSGSRADLGAVFRALASRRGGARPVDHRIFERRSAPTKRDYVLTLLVDLSGSMANGDKIEETFRATVLLSEVLNRLGLRFEVLGFQDTIVVFKAFREGLDEAVRRRMSGMVDEVRGTNPGGHNEPAYNDDGPCVLTAAESLDAEPGSEKFLLVLSDGVPAGKRSNEEDLRAAIRRILATTRVNLVGLGLGEGTAHVRDFYPVSLADMRVAELPRQLGDLVEALLRDPDAFRGRAEEVP